MAQGERDRGLQHARDDFLGQRGGLWYRHREGPEAVRKEHHGHREEQKGWDATILPRGSYAYAMII